MEAAQRQLEMSIRMFFKNEDPIHNHTLATAAHEVLWNIGKKRKIRSILKDNPFIKKEKKAEFDDIVRSASRFLKHGKYDFTETLDFNPEENEYFLIDSIEMFQQLNSSPKIPPIMLLMKAWFQLAKPDLYADSPESQKLRDFCQQIDLKPEDKSRFLAFEDDFKRIQLG